MFIKLWKHYYLQCNVPSLPGKTEIQGLEGYIIFVRFRESKISYATYILYSNAISFSQSLSSLPKDTIFYSVSITQIVSQQSGYNIGDIGIGKQMID